MHLSEINIYPVKSLKGIGLREAVIEDRGLLSDRRWMLVDRNNRFLTQREFPVMATVSIHLDGDKFSARAGDNKIEVPFEPGSGEFQTTQIWKSEVVGEFYSSEIDEWFSRALDTNCRLVRMPEASKRAVNPDYAVRGSEDIVSFADGYPFMLIGQASLDDLNARLPEPLPMNRFRPNFVVEGSDAFAEDNWQKIRIAETIFHIVKPCERCVIPTIDQTTGVKTGKEPTKTLSTYRLKDGNVLFGQNLIAEQAGGTVRVGDAVEILELKNGQV